jgi:hypothetical protein
VTVSNTTKSFYVSWKKMRGKIPILFMIDYRQMTCEPGFANMKLASLSTRMTTRRQKCVRTKTPKISKVLDSIG